MMKALDNEPYNWYMVFTAPYAEMRVKKQLDEAGIANCLPLRTSRLLWRNKMCARRVPVMPRCIFVHLPVTDMEKLANIASLLLPADLPNCRLSDQQIQEFVTQ